MSDRALARAGSRIVPGSVATLIVPPVWMPVAPPPEVDVVAGSLLPPQPAARRTKTKTAAPPTTAARSDGDLTNEGYLLGGVAGGRGDLARLEDIQWLFIEPPRNVGCGERQTP